MPALATINGADDKPHRIIIDPNNKFPNISPDDIIASMGLLPHILAQSAGGSYKERAENGYQFGCHWYDSGERGGCKAIDSTGRYMSMHKDDPDLEPLATFHAPDGETAHVYQYGLIAVRGEVNWTTARLD